MVFSVIFCAAIAGPFGSKQVLANKIEELLIKSFRDMDCGFMLTGFSEYKNKLLLNYCMVRFMPKIVQFITSGIKKRDK